MNLEDFKNRYSSLYRFSAYKDIDLLVKEVERINRLVKMMRILLSAAVFFGSIYLVAWPFQWAKLNINQNLLGFHITNIVVMVFIGAVCAAIAWKKLPD